MALTDILKKITGETDLEVSSILDQAKNEASKIIENANANASTQKNILIEKALLSASEEEKRQLTLADLEVRKKLLQEKMEAVDNVFLSAMRDISSMNTNDHRSIMKKLLLANVNTGNEGIIACEHRKDVWTNEFIAELNSEVGRGKGLKLEAFSKDRFEGFVLKEDNIEIDCRLDKYFSVLKERTLHKVAEILFDGNLRRGEK